MRLLSITKCEAGMEVAKPIYTDQGNVLVGAGVALTKRMIDRLAERGVMAIYIQDAATADLEIPEDIPAELRVEAARAVQDAFKSMTQANHKWRKAVDVLHIDKLQAIFKSLAAELAGSKHAISLMANIYAHDDYVFAHSANVTIYSLAMAMKSGDFNDKMLRDLALGGLLHDIGKTFIATEVLNKKGKLTEGEFEQIKQHTTLGFDLLRAQPEVPLIAAHCAFQHHEKVDGSGYPRGITGEEIHPFAKIMAIADVFDALTSNRAYRGAMLPHEAMEIIFAGAGTHFETDMIQLFQRSVAAYPIGVTVQLSTGHTAVVTNYQFQAPGRPIVRVIQDASGSTVGKPYELDLAKELTVMITGSDSIL